MRVKSPSIALLVPCHNAAPYLTDLSASLQASQIPFDEVFFYDDGSTDDTIKAVRDHGYTLHSGTENLGASHARNYLASLSHAEWLHFHDADDPILPDFLSRMLPLMDADTDVVVCDANWENEDRTETLLRWRYASGLWPDALSANLSQGVSCNSMIVRREVFLRAGGFRTALRMWEDADLHIRLAAAGARYRGLGEVAALSIRRASSFSHDYRANWNWRLQALESYEHLLPARAGSLIAAEAENAARQLLHYDDQLAARRALALNHRMGGDCPRTANPILRCLKPLLSSFTLLRLQEKFRTGSA